MKKNIIELLVKHEVFGEHTLNILNKAQHQGRSEPLLKEEAKSIMKTLLSPSINVTLQKMVEECCFKLVLVFYPETFKAMVLNNNKIQELVVAYTQQEPDWSRLGQMCFTGQQMKFYPFGFSKDNSIPGSTVLLLCLSNTWQLSLSEISELYPDKQFISANANDIFEKVAQYLAKAPEGTQIYEQDFIDYYMVYQLNFVLFASRYSLMNLSTILHYVSPKLMDKDMMLLVKQLGFAHQNLHYSKKVKGKRRLKVKGSHKKKASKSCYLLKNYKIDHDYQSSPKKTENILSNGKGGLFERAVSLRNQFKKETEEHNLNVHLIKSIIDGQSRFWEMYVYQMSEVITHFAKRLIHFNDYYIFRITLLKVHIFVDEAFKRLAEHIQSIATVDQWLKQPFKTSKALLNQAHGVLQRLPDEQQNTRTILIGRVDFLLSLIDQYDQTIERNIHQIEEDRKQKEHKQLVQVMNSANAKMMVAVKERDELKNKIKNGLSGQQALMTEHQMLQQQNTLLHQSLKEHQDITILTLEIERLKRNKSQKERVIINSAKAIDAFFKGHSSKEITMKNVDQILAAFEQHCHDIHEQWQNRLWRIERANQKKQFVRMLLMHYGVVTNGLKSLPEYLNALCDFTEQTNADVSSHQRHYHHNWATFFHQGAFDHSIQSSVTQHSQVEIQQESPVIHQINHNQVETPLYDEERESQISKVSGVERSSQSKASSTDQDALSDALEALRSLTLEINELKTKLVDGKAELANLKNDIVQEQKSIKHCHEQLGQFDSHVLERYSQLHDELDGVRKSINHLNNLKDRINLCCDGFYRRGTIDEKIDKTFEIIEGRANQMDRWQRQKKAVQIKMRRIKNRMSLLSGIDDELSQEELITGLANQLHYSISQMHVIHNAFHEAYMAGYCQEAYTSVMMENKNNISS